MFDMHPAPVVTASVVAVTLLAASACGRGEPSTSSSPSDIVRMDGSSTVYPITEAVAEEFRLVDRNFRVTIGRQGTGGGFQRLCRGESDIAGASRPIHRTEMDDCARNGVTFVELPVAYDGVTVVVHPANTWATSMTVDELRRLWEPAAQGRVTRWSHVRAGWPERPVRLFGAGVDSGTFDFFTREIVGQARASRGDYTASEDDNILVQGVSGDELALGYFGHAYYEENQGSLRAVAIDDGEPGNGDGPIVPTLESVRAGTYRPLSRPVFIYVAARSLERRDVLGFVEFYLATSGELVGEIGYVPLTEQEYALARQRLAARATGTVFGGREAAVGPTLPSLPPGTAD
jgi:phosphate transport system substrate-binding protein